MKEISAEKITATVQKLCIEANYFLNQDIIDALKEGIKTEESSVGKEILEQIVENANVAKTENMAICQDTGMTVVFLDVGQEVHISGGRLNDAINEGVRRGYKEGFLRNSIVRDPLERVNTGDNTPAIIHYEIVSGENIKITVAPKGFGSENMSAVKMLKPSDGIDGVKKFIMETVENAGPNACPPLIVGIGIGGTIEKAAILAKKALTRSIDKSSPSEFYRDLELELLNKINKLGIGPSGFGGNTTALSVNIETFPTHIAGLPVAVNISCHATRHMEAIL
ncbi:MAG: fumarate hydratase [Clostridia bacterium]|jgi:fumarate hydratase subunit alpha